MCSYQCFLLFAFSSEAARAVRTRFEQRRVGKSYLAVLRGPRPVQGEVDHPLRSYLYPHPRPLARQ